MIIILPSDKSITHRALIFAAMAQGQTSIYAPLNSADTQATLNCILQLGVRIKVEDEHLWVLESPGYSKWKDPKYKLNCDNSGTTARLLLGVLASIPDLAASLDGDESLRRRPFKRLARVLLDAGAELEFENGEDGLPISIYGRHLKPLNCEWQVASAQLKTAAILAALTTPGEHSIRLPKGSRDHTEQLCQYWGIKLTITIQGSVENIKLLGPQAWKATTVRVPADPSSAAFISVLGLLIPHSERFSMPYVVDNPTRLGFYEVLKKAGARISKAPITSEHSPEPLCEIFVESMAGDLADLRGLHITSEMVPSLIDELPILAVAAAFANGTSEFFGLSELRHKESDRLAQIVSLLSAAGVAVQAFDDKLVIHGPAARLQPFAFDTLGDHRMAMCAAILEKIVGKPCDIKDRECVQVSFPNFYQTLEEACQSE